MLTLYSTSAQETAAFGKQLGLLLKPGDIVLLSGDLGAGKTEFTKGIAEALGVSEPITSPTFNIMIEHSTTQGFLLRHFDLYRLEKTEELEDIDYFGLLEDNAVSVVEWGDKFPQAQPADFLLVSLELQDDDARALTFSAIGADGVAWSNDTADASATTSPATSLLARLEAALS